MLRMPFPPIAPIILPAGSTGNLLNQLLWISGPLWLATPILPLLHDDLDREVLVLSRPADIDPFEKKRPGMPITYQKKKRYKRRAAPYPPGLNLIYRQSLVVQLLCWADPHLNLVD